MIAGVLQQLTAFVIVAKTISILAIKRVISNQLKLTKTLTSTFLLLNDSLQDKLYSILEKYKILDIWLEGV